MLPGFLLTSGLEISNRLEPPEEGEASRLRGLRTVAAVICAAGAIYLMWHL